MNRSFTRLLPAAVIGLALLAPFLQAPAAAQMTVTGESLTIERAAPSIGDILYMTLRFRVEGFGAAIPIAFSAVESTAIPDPDRPTAASRSYDIRPASPHSVRMEYRLPRPVPTEMCFNVYAHFTGTGLRSALIFQNACWGATPRSGTGQRIELKPDLTVSIDAVSVDRTIEWSTYGEVFHPMDLSFTVRNIGTAPTGISGVCWSFSFHLPRSVVALPAGWNEHDSHSCGPIPGGGSQSFSRRYQIPAVTDRIRITADPVNALREIREDNNTAERLIGVPPRIRGTEPVKPDIRKK
ncbi:MAG: hypothetical protein HPY67_11560 [Syntrophaceae bacterium]|nr:hypothetical protein [Syntrophaceae bacterium]